MLHVYDIKSAQRSRCCDEIEVISSNTKGLNNAQLILHLLCVLKLQQLRLTGEGM